MLRADLKGCVKKSVGAVGAPAFDGQFHFVTLEALAQGLAQGRLQLRGGGAVTVGIGQHGGQEVGAIAGIQAEHAVAAGALEVAVLVLLALRMVVQPVFSVIGTSAMRSSSIE